MKKLQNIDVTALLRPARIALVIKPSEINNQYLTEVLIPFILSHWSGANHFILPYEDDLNLDSVKFKEWLSLLQRFDPDSVFSTTITTQDFKDVVVKNIMTDDFFEHAPRVARPCLGHRGMQARTKLEDVFSSSNTTPPNIFEYDLVGDPYLDLWFSSTYGRLRSESSHLHRWVQPQTTTIANLYSGATNVATWKFNAQESPYLCSNIHIGQGGVKGLFFEGTLPRIVVIGDSIEDWSLYFSLRILYDLVFWVPKNLLNNSGSTLDKMDSFLADLLSEYSFNNSSYPPILTSISLSDADLQNEVSALEQRGNNTFTPYPTYNYTTELNLTQLFDNWISKGEFNNKNEQCIFISDTNESIQRVPSIAPRNFSPQPQDVKYYVELVSDQYKFLGHPLCTTPPIVWKNPRARTKDDARKTITGDLSFWGMNHLIRPGQDLNSLLHGPRLRILYILEQFSEILKHFDYSCHKTVGTQNIETVLSMWDYSLYEFCKDFFINDTARIFDVYRQNYDLRDQRTISNFDNNSGIFFNRRFFSTFLDKNSYTPPLTSDIDQCMEHWLDSRVLIRGEQLQCQTCGKKLFYNEEEAPRYFNCKKCGNKNLKNHQSMGHLEPQFVYDLNPLMYSLLESNSHVVIKTLNELSKLSITFFDWTTEIQLKNPSGDDIMEIDIVANIDGELYIGECKSNSKIDAKQAKKYAWLCKRLQIKNIVFGSEKGWSQANKTTIESFFSSILEINIIFI